MRFELFGYSDRFGSNVARAIRHHVSRIVGERSNAVQFGGCLMLVNTSVLPSGGLGEFFPPDTIRLACLRGCRCSRAQLGAAVVNDGWLGRWNHEWGHAILHQNMVLFDRWKRLWSQITEPISSLCTNPIDAFCECWSAHLSGLPLPNALNQFMSEVGR